MTVVFRTAEAVGCPVSGDTLVCVTLDGDNPEVGYVDHADNFAWDGSGGIGRVVTFECAPFPERKVPQRAGPYLLRAFAKSAAASAGRVEEPGPAARAHAPFTVQFDTSAQLGATPSVLPEPPLWWGAEAPDGDRVLAGKGYEELADVLYRAFNQAASGKGADRHARDGEAFRDQVMADMAKRFGVGALLGQAFKKSEESQRLPRERAVAELLGAINYLAGAVIALERQ